MPTNHNKPAVAPVTKGDTHGTVDRWAVDVTVPDDWDEENDRQYSKDTLGIDCLDQLVDNAFAKLEDYHGVLTFAFCYLTDQPYEPHSSIFRHLPVGTKLAMLGKLFRQRSQDAGYLDRFDCGLRRFLDVEQLCLPVLERYLLDPESVWLRELVDVGDNIAATVMDFAESLGCEHDDCPRYWEVDRVDPPLDPEESCSGPDTSGQQTEAAESKQRKRGHRRGAITGAPPPPEKPDRSVGERRSVPQQTKHRRHHLTARSNGKSQSEKL